MSTSDLEVSPLAGLDQRTLAEDGVEHIDVGALLDDLLAGLGIARARHLTQVQPELLRLASLRGHVRACVAGKVMLQQVLVQLKH